MDKYEQKARDEARRLNREYRPGSRESTREARRLEDGFKMMAEAEDGPEEDDDE